jgi:predicted alpha/beta hydrolase family esterase
MRTIILPGYSAHNKDWAEDIKKELGGDVVAHEWKHWQMGGSLSLGYELEQIQKKIGKKEVNIIAKSAGVMVALNLITKISSQINKVILCGIASVASKDRKELLAEAVNTLGAKNFLCIQNENDKFVPHPDAEKFYHAVEPKLKVISKPRSDHHYPYPEDFRRFLGI